MSRGIWSTAEDDALLKLYRLACAFSDMSDFMLRAGFPLRREADYRSRVEVLLKFRRDPLVVGTITEPEKPRNVEYMQIEVMPGQTLQDVIDSANNRGGAHESEPEPAPEQAIQTHTTPTAPVSAPKHANTPMSEAEIAEVCKIADTGASSATVEQAMVKAGFPKRHRLTYLKMARENGHPFKSKPGPAKGVPWSKEAIKSMRERNKKRRQRFDAWTAEEVAELRRQLEAGTKWRDVPGKMVEAGFRKRSAEACQIRASSEGIKSAVPHGRPRSASSQKALREKLNAKLGLTKMRFTEIEDARIKSLSRRMTMQELAAQMEFLGFPKRSPSTYRNRLKLLGCKRASV